MGCQLYFYSWMFTVTISDTNFPKASSTSPRLGSWPRTRPRQVKGMSSSAGYACSCWEQNRPISHSAPSLSWEHVKATLSMLLFRKTAWPSHSLAGGKGPLEFILSKPSARAWPPRPSCPVPHPDNSWASPRKETPRPLWAPCASAWSTPQWKSVSSCSEGTSRASVCAYFLWAPLRRAWLCLLDSLPC